MQRATKDSESRQDFRHWRRPKLRVSFASAAFILALTINSACAAPSVDYFFPPAAARGATASVVISGKIEKWPLDVWVDRPGVSAVADEKKGTLKVSVAADASPGVYWLRCYDDTGAAAPKPFCVGSLPHVEEAEPNDAPTAAHKLVQSSIAVGKLAKQGDVDTFAITLNKGQTLIASVMAERVFASPMDCVLQICDERGFVLAHNDDEIGIDPQLVFEAPQDGEFLVRLFAFPATATSSIQFAGGENFVYRLTIARDAFVDHAIPTAVQVGTRQQVALAGWGLENNERDLLLKSSEPVAVSQTGVAGFAALLPVEHPVRIYKSPETPLPVPSVVCGQIAAADEKHSLVFSAKKGQKIEFNVQSRSQGFALDGVLTLFDMAGKKLAENDDANKLPDPSLTFTAPEDGEFKLLLHDLHDRGGLRYSYILTAKPVLPDFAIAVASDSFVAKAAESVEVEVSIERSNGFAERIVVTAEGLPEGVACEPVESELKADSEKKVKLKLTGSEPVSGPFQIIARCTVNGEEMVRKAEVVSRRFWITVTPAEK